MIRMRIVACFAAAALGVSLPAIVEAQGRREDYARAQKFLNEEIKKLAYDGQVDAHWLNGTTQFWYLKDALDSKEFLIVDAVSGSKNPAFDHQRLAAGLSSVAGRRYDAKALPFSYVQFGAGAKTVAFAVEQNTFRCDCPRTSAQRRRMSSTKTRKRPATDHRASRTRRGCRAPNASRPIASSSPSSASTTSGCATSRPASRFELSKDGEHFYDYATPLPSPTLMVAQGTEDVVQAPRSSGRPTRRRSQPT